MAGNNVNIDSLAAAIAEELAQYNEAVAEGVKAAVDKSSKTAVKTLSETSPINARSRRKHYKTKWRSKTMFENRLQKRNTVHNLEYQLPHLLEKPHQTRGGGRTRAQVHIAPVEQKAIEELTKETERLIQNGGK